MTAKGKTQSLAGRLAGAALVLVGAVNLVLGAIAAADPFLGLRPAEALALIGGGVVLLVAGVPVWRGSRIATAVALTVMACLLAVGLFQAIAEDGASWTLLAVPAVLTALLAVAAVRQRA